MPRIKIEVKDNIATNLTPEIEIVSNNGDYEIEFSFDSLWDSYSVKTARFYYNFSHTDIVFDGNVCKVPLLEETQLLKVGVFTDTNKTTTDAEIKCRFSIKKYGGNVHEPSKDVYGQIIDLLNKYIEQGGSGGVNREEVERIIDEYLTENPPKDGVDGFSPTITTTAIENGTRVEITDINGTKSFDVLNGKDGTQVDLSEYQKSTDESLETESKDIVGAINEINAKTYLEGDGAPTTATVGTIGQLYTDTTNGNTYQCTAITDGAYTWVKLVQETELNNKLTFTEYSKPNEPITNINYRTSGGLVIDASKTLRIYGATESQIKQQSQALPLYATQISLITKTGLTANKLTLTDEEKASALKWLGVTDLIEKLKSDNNLS